MAKIICKQGREGGRTIGDIEGIAIDLLSGRTALVYPKYKRLPLLEEEQIEGWKAEDMTEIEALRVTDAEPRTTDLLEAGSPAAAFVRQFGSGRFGAFQLPPLLAAMEVAGQREEIDGLAETIEGADLLMGLSSLVWSCSRSYVNSGWCAVDSAGFAARYFLYSSGLAVPFLLLPASWDAPDA